jgi:hypothetical protein
MPQHAQRVNGNVSQTCRFFGASRALFYIWKKRYEKNGLAGLRDPSRRPHHIRYRIPSEIVSLILRIRKSAATVPFEPVSIFNATTTPTSRRPSSSKYFADIAWVATSRSPL